MTTENSAYENVLIIGNGFDLNLDLKTSYTDFVNSVQFDHIVLNGNYLAKYLKDKHDLQKWIDIENELKNYSNRTSGFTKESFENFETDFNSLSLSLKTYLSGIKYNDLNKDSHAYKLLDFLKDKDLLILDYNYTKTAKSILSEFGWSESDLNKRIIKVHGSIDEDEIIFGVEDKAKIRKEHVFLRKAYSKHFKAIDTNDILKKCKYVFIFGHSLGMTDHMYFDDFFREMAMPFSKGKGKAIYVFHYGKKGYLELFIQLDELTLNSLSIFKQNNHFEMIDTKQ